MKPQPCKIGVLGVGAIGSVVAFELLKNHKNHLYFYNRSKKTALKILKGSIAHEIPIIVDTSLQDDVALDWLFICLKEHQYKEAHHWFSSLINTNTTIVVIRNGIDLKDSIIPFTPSKTNIISCMIDCPVQPIAEGFYNVLQSPTLIVSIDEYSEKFKDLFQESLTIIKTPDFKTASWMKLCESASLGAVLFLAGTTCIIFKEEQWTNKFEQILEECILVANTDGAMLPSSFKDDLLYKVKSYPPEKGSSMLTDKLRGTVIEIGAKNGIISDKSSQYGIATPENDALVKKLIRWNSSIRHKMLK